MRCIAKHGGGPEHDWTADCDLIDDLKAKIAELEKAGQAATNKAAVFEMTLGMVIEAASKAGWREALDDEPISAFITRLANKAEGVK